MADIQPIRSYELPTFSGSLTDYVFWIDKQGIPNAVKITGQVLETLLNHNNLTGKQGGQTNQFYHLTASEKTIIERAGSDLYGRWNRILAAQFNSTPASANTITTVTDFRNVITKYSPLKIVQGAVTSYAIVTDITDTTITIAGENTFDSGDAIDLLYFGERKNIEIYELHLPDEVWETTPNANVLESQGLSTLFNGKVLYVVTRGATVGASTFLQIKNSTNNVINLNSGNGLQVGLIGSTWNNSGMNINPTYNYIDGSLRIDTTNTGVPSVEKVSVTIFVLII